MSATPGGGLPGGDASAGWSVFSTLLAGLLVWGGVGYLLGRWLHIAALFPIGVVLGVAVSTYSVYVRYGRSS